MHTESYLPEQTAVDGLGRTDTLQRTVGTRDDGLIGPLTLGALKLVLEREAPGALAGRLARQRIAFYRELAKRDPEQRVFLQGWLNRVEKLETAAGIG